MTDDEKKERLESMAREAELYARWEAMVDLVNGREVSDFLLSFPEVRKLSDAIDAGTTNE